MRSRPSERAEAQTFDDEAMALHHAAAATSEADEALADRLETFARASLGRGVMAAPGAATAWFEAARLSEDTSLKEERTLRGTRLTPQERAVAKLVAQGKRNREIAADLVVSVKTVEYHLGHVYQKLNVAGCGSRRPRSRQRSRRTRPPSPGR
ncbi:MAG: helix-turn-helix transcriptional regulator [Acidimicrobiales bacterium]